MLLYSKYNNLNNGGSMKSVINITIAVLICTACTNLCTKTRKSMSAEEVVKAYLSIAFNMKKVSQKRLLLQYTMGPLQAAIASANEKTIIEAYIKPRYKLHSIAIISKKNITPREVQITYQLEYKEANTNEDIKDVENESIKQTVENTVSLYSLKSRWFINGVIDNKTSIEFPITTIKGSKQ